MIKIKIKYLDNFILGILAGIAIGVGGFLNLLFINMNLKYLGGVLFSVGLFTICLVGLHLYTGKIGYVLENKKDYLLSLLIMLIGNMIGAIGFGYLLYLTGISTNGILKDTVTNVINNKLILFNDEAYKGVIKVLIYSFFCGIMVFLAVHIFKISNNFIIKTINLVICVALFVITGMEHCIANMFYFAIGNAYVHIGECLLSIGLAILGNSGGAILTYLVFKSFNKTSKDSK